MVRLSSTVKLGKYLVDNQYKWLNFPSAGSRNVETESIVREVGMSISLYGLTTMRAVPFD